MRVSDNKKNNILILGSKPSAKIIPNDYTYAANASAGYYKKQLVEKGVKKIISLISAADMDTNDLVTLNEQKRKAKINKIKLVKNGNSSEIIVLGANTFSGAYNIFNEFKKIKSKLKISFLDNYIAYDVIKSVTGKTCPIISWDHFTSPTISWTHVIKVYLKDFLIRKLFTTKDTSGLFRPSTGLLCLLFAIERHGKEAKYTISGIDFNKRGIYLDHINTWSKKENLTDYHIIVDKVILNQLKRNYNIIIT